jgi:eukaryotic-like serine/threonine-protein kinase
MSLSAGARLGPYEIEAPLGAGGMGEVYRARDTRLDRTVAVKILTTHLATDEEFRKRFEREARTLSHLNHRHVCTLHDVGHDGGTEFLVMEYVVGETLAARLTRERSGLPLNDAIKIAIEIASALDAAHRLGITHRDLKPGNVMLTKAGAKLLDFGLAKAENAISVQADNTTQPTRTAPFPSHETPVTAKGTILGTLQFMAPEQIEGQATDARTDIFAFGALVHEMITGRKSFQGKSQASLIGSILKDDPPPISSIQTASPPALDFVVRKCLAKDPDDRWQSARDVMSQLEWIAQNGGSSVATPATSGRIPAVRRREGVAWSIAGILAVLLASAVATKFFAARTSEARDVRFEVPTPGANPFDMAISPDGRLIAFVAKAPDSNSDVLWLRPLAATVAQPLAGTDGALSPFWSPDSRSIGFGAGERLKRVDVAGGPPRTVCDIPPHKNINGTWNRENTIVFSDESRLLRVDAEGGQPTAVTTMDPTRHETMHLHPTFLPDGRHFLYAVQSTDPANAGVYARSLDSPDRTRVLDAVSNVAYAEPGHLIYSNAGALLAQPFDASRLRPNGKLTRIVENVAVSPWSRLGGFSASSSGAILYRAGGAGSSQLQWFDRAGNPLERLGQFDSFWGLALSPDEKRVALSRPDSERGRTDIWTVELSTGVPTRVTFDPASDDDAAWTPDGLALTFWSDRNGKYGIYKRTLGSAADLIVYESPTPLYLGDWSPDGKFLLCHNTQAVLALPMVGPREPLRLIESSYSKDEPHFAPDGKWVAYNSNESGASEVYVASFPAFDRRRQVSLGEGGVPWWRADGRELFYMSRDGKLMSVPITPGPASEFGAPTVLFQTPIRSPILRSAQYVVTRDGQRFLLAVPAGTTTTPLTVVLDWTTLLR